MTWSDVFAPAKVNLTLHITGQRDDGYHLLDSPVAFAPVGDALRVAPAEDLTLRLEGPEAEGLPANGDNLALRAAAMVGEGQGAAIVLEKVLPVASGIGGGSADAAAAARAVLAEAGALDADGLARAEAALLALGADVPMCLASRPVRVRGIGEALTPISLPPLPAVLVNPRVPVSTPQIFRSLTARDNSPMPERLLRRSPATLPRGRAPRAQRGVLGRPEPRAPVPGLRAPHPASARPTMCGQG